MLPNVKQLAGKSRTAIISYHMYDNWKTKQRFRSGNIALTSGSTHIRFNLEGSLKYINQVFDDYLHYGGFSPDDLKGKRILEVGPGDNIGVAIKLLAAGAEQVVCLDKFFSPHDWGQQRAIYTALKEELPEDKKHVVDSVIDFEKGMKVDTPHLQYLFGEGVEEAGEKFAPGSFDLIISRAVFEHVYDPDAAFIAMQKLLKAGGWMLHKIDFRDHGIFSQYKHHPLTFLTIPDAIYHLMAYDSGKPNRKLMSYYRQRASELGFDAKCLITHIVGIKDEVIPYKECVEYGTDYTDATLALLKQVRPRLQKEFKNLSDEDLMVSGIFLIAQKL